MELSNPHICSKCGKPSSGSGGATITQWVAICHCDALRLEESQTSDVETKTCAVCGKRIEAHRHGSLTQWIFRENSCRCQFPQILTLRLPAIQPAEGVVEETEDTYIEVEDGLLPSERYKPIRLLGQGTLGKVFLCRDTLLAKKVAVKVLELTGDELLTAFRNQAKTLSKIDHPHIIKVFDSGANSDGRPYMILEYFAGVNLEETIKDKGRMPEQLVLKLFDEICDALRLAHEHGIRHRDLQLNQILIGNVRGRIDFRITGFGLSMLKSTSTASGDTEEAGNKIESADEVMAVGRMMHQALSGKILGVQSSGGMLPPLQDENDLISKRVTELVDKCVTGESESRFKTIEELHEEITELSNKHAEGAALEASFGPIKISPKRLLPYIPLIVILSLTWKLIAITTVVLFFAPKPEQEKKVDKPVERSTTKSKAPPRDSRPATTSQTEIDLPSGSVGLKLDGNKVVNVRPFMAAYAAGIKPGDEVLAVNSRKSAELKGDALSKSLEGSYGSIAKVTFKSGNKVFTKELERAPDVSRSLPRKATAKSYFNFGIKEKADGHINEAMLAFTMASRADTGPIRAAALQQIKSELPKEYVGYTAQTLSIRAHNAMIARQYELAAKDFKSLTAKYPKFEWPYLNLAIIYYIQHKYDLAEQCTNKVLAINPDFSAAWIASSILKTKKGDTKLAQECMVKATALNPKAEQERSDLLNAVNTLALSYSLSR